ncbi:MAG: type II secretion system protein [Elusimicrobia bacterium]|nr:type II secretion system protein [Elusimicrobiota bacterium]
MKNSGFTLIELMVVVTIIGILAAISVPKMADLIYKSKEGATKGALGTLRSAITIYYAELEGLYPWAINEDGTRAVNNEDIVTFSGAPMVTKYLDKCPKVRLGHKSGLDDTNECVFCSEFSLLTPEQAASGKWWYRGQQVGDLFIAAGGFTDMGGKYITSW